MIRWIGLTVDREQGDCCLAEHLAKACQHRGMKVPRHGSPQCESERCPSPYPSRLLASERHGLLGQTQSMPGHHEVKVGDRSEILLTPDRRRRRRGLLRRGRALVARLSAAHPAAVRAAADIRRTLSAATGPAHRRAGRRSVARLAIGYSPCRPTAVARRLLSIFPKATSSELSS